MLSVDSSMDTRYEGEDLLGKVLSFFGPERGKLIWSGEEGVTIDCGEETVRIAYSHINDGYYVIIESVDGSGTIQFSQGPIKMREE